MAVYRAPMRSRNDAVEPEATIDRARRHGLCGFGQLVSQSAEQARLDRRVTRFAELDNGSFVWTRDTDGLFWLGRISGPYFYDADETAAAVDLVHVRPCEWLPPRQSWNRMCQPPSLPHSVGADGASGNPPPIDR